MKSERIFLTVTVFLVTLSFCIGSVNALVLGAYPVSEQDPLGMGVQNIINYQNVGENILRVTYSDGTSYENIGGNIIRIKNGANSYEIVGGIVRTNGNGAIFAPYAGSLSKTSDSGNLGVNYHSQLTQTTASPTPATTTNEYSSASATKQNDSGYNTLINYIKNNFVAICIGLLIFSCLCIIIAYPYDKEELSESIKNDPLLNSNESGNTALNSSNTSYNHQEDQTEVHYHISAENYFANDVGILAKDDAVINRSNIGNDSGKEEPEFCFCPKCGAKVGAEDTFCRKCGEKLN